MKKIKNQNKKDVTIRFNHFKTYEKIQKFSRILNCTIGDVFDVLVAQFDFALKQHIEKNYPPDHAIYKRFKAEESGDNQDNISFMLNHSIKMNDLKKIETKITEELNEEGKQ